MPQTNPTPSLEEAVAASQLLKDEEKKHWLTAIPRMTEDQRAKLTGILEGAATLPWNDNMKNYVETADPTIIAPIAA